MFVNGLDAIEKFQVEGVQVAAGVDGALFDAWVGVDVCAGFDRQC